MFCTVIEVKILARISLLHSQMCDKIYRGLVSV